MAKQPTANKEVSQVTSQDLETRIQELTQQNEALTLEKESLEADNLKLVDEKQALVEINETYVADNLKLAEENAKLKDALEQPINEVKKPVTKEEFLRTRKTIEIEGHHYGFKFDAPSILSIKGVPRKTSDLIKDKAIMEEFVHGNAFFVELVK